MPTMSAVSCNQVLAKALARPLENMPLAQGDTDAREGSRAKTWRVRAPPDGAVRRLRVSSYTATERDAMKREVELTCRTSEAEAAPHLFDAGVSKISPWKLQLLLEDYELGSLAEYADSLDVNDSPAWAELDAAVERLLQKMRDRRICHRDLHSDNVVLRRMDGGALEARAIDWESGTALKACGRSDAGLILATLPAAKTRLLPLVRAFCESQPYF